MNHPRSASLRLSRDRLSNCSPASLNTFSTNSDLVFTLQDRLIVSGRIPQLMPFSSFYGIPPFGRLSLKASMVIHPVECLPCERRSIFHVGRRSFIRGMPDAPWSMMLDFPHSLPEHFTQNRPRPVRLRRAVLNNRKRLVSGKGTPPFRERGEQSDFRHHLTQLRI